MEDRNTPALYLEMSSMDPDEYAVRRVPEVLADPSVARATWWENVVPDRSDLPRTMPDFTLLGLFELGDGFTRPRTPPGVTAHHFERYPRPGQGCLTGKPTIGLSLVLISPRDPARAQALRDWGDFVHIRHIAEVGVPGYSMITPYENVDGDGPRFMHLYEMDTEDPEASFQRMTPLVSEHLADRGADYWTAWARSPDLRIDYVNTFRRLGARAGVGGAAVRDEAVRR